ncbi:MAG: C25 family cysteine peptidase [Salibacteraceae bacterium]
MKRFTLIVLSIFLGFQSVGQPLANSWIDYEASRFYFKFKISETGVCRIPHNTLQFAMQQIGVDLSNVDPNSLQVFGRGKEQYIFVEGSSDGSFDSGDYIEFYAQKNDGWADEVLYPDANSHTNPYYSLYNDTATYFVTWSPTNTASSFRYENKAYGTAAVTPVSYVLKTLVRFFNNNYQKGIDLGAGKPKATYDGGKGWMSNNFGYNSGNTSGIITSSFPTTSPYNGSATNPAVEVALSGINIGAGGNQAHHTQIQVNTGNGFNAISNVLYSSFDYVRDMSTISEPLTSTTQIRLVVSQAVSQINTASDYSACAYINLTYPRTLAMNGEDFFECTVPQAQSTQHFSATNFSSAQVDCIYDLGQNKRYEVSQNGGSIRANIDAGNQRSLVLASSNKIKTLGSQELVPVEGTGKFTDPSSSEREKAYIIISHKKLQTEAERYRTYRSSDFNTVLIDIETLYDQFAFGIRKHPLAIRNFADYALKTWNTAPQHLFLLGKSIAEETMRKNSNYMARSLIPCMGFPPSDISITAGLDGKKTHVPAIPTGRLAARNNEEIAVYLSKVREFEQAQNLQIMPYTIDNRKWQKHILHFAGGSDGVENNRFKGYLSSYQSYVEDSLFAGKTFLFSKTSGNVIEQLNTDSVRLLIKQGAALLTFFGHASGNSFDLSVDDPSLWDNRGRYPMVIANSCFSGNIHLPVEAIGSISEQYLFTPNEGAISFIATPDLSYESYLNTYTNTLYRQLSRDNYGKSFSEQMQATTDALPGDERNTTVALEMTLHGDPALMLYPHDRTELTINDPIFGADVSFSPSNITTDLDSFEVNVNLTNLGRSTSKSFNVTVTRNFPNGAQPVIQTMQVDGINFGKNLRFKFNTDAENGIGENELTVDVDLPLSAVEEHIENTNNQVTRLPFFISSSDIFPVFPYDFAVVPDFDVTLRANTGYPFLNSNTYSFEIDTTDTYDSPFKKSTSITQSGAVLNWNPQLGTTGLKDSTVLFWRVSPTNDLSKWREFSFQVIQGRNGWGQDHFFQYKNNEFDLIDYDRNHRQFDFKEASRELFVQVIGNPSLNEFEDNFYSLDGQNAPLGEYGIANIQPGFAVVVIDSAELKPWGTYGIGPEGSYINEDKRFGNNNDGNAHRSRVEYFFTFNVSNAQMNSMIDMIQNHVDDGHYLLFYTQQRGLFKDTNIWTNPRLDFFESLGADSIRHVPNLSPYIFLVKKGDPSSAEQVIGQTDREIIRLSSNLISNFSLGSMSGPNIGPAMEWGNYFMKKRALESNSVDIVEASISGITPDQNTFGLDTLAQSGSSDLSSYDANDFPFMTLDFYTEDNTAATPAQLKNWHVLYEPAPEAAINPIKGQTYQAGEELRAGIDFNFGVAIENISDFPFDDFKVRYWFVDGDNKIMEEKWLNYEAMAAGEVIFDSVAFSTNGLAGRYFMYVEVNPRDEDWHKEQFHFNNRAYIAFEVKADKKNPILDVTFDGIHIINGDIVSPQPEIVMALKDENPFLLMKDTSSFDVFMTYPTGLEKRISFISNGKEIMFFEPADEKQNKARLTYQPEEPLADGEYSLKVMGRDASGNESGKNAYTIDFEVINKSSVTHVMNYPNPFTTATKFVFTLTGSQIPDVFTIQIMTVTGKVVREITKMELGNIHVGRNITDYTWNGTDEFGDRLANGVYLYRVIMKLNGDKIEHRSTAADNYFVKDFGKMYLFR